MVKHYYKVLDENGEVVMVGYGYNDNEITKEEYDEILKEKASQEEEINEDIY